MSTLETAKTSTIDTELSRGNLRFLPKFLKKNYTLLHGKYRQFRKVRVISKNGRELLSYRVLVPQTRSFVDVIVETGPPITVTMTPSSANVPESFLSQLHEDLFLMVQLFEEHVRKTTLYFAFLPGEKIVPEDEKTRPTQTIFADSMLPLYVLLMALTFLLFSIFGFLAPIIFVCISFLLSLFSGKIVARIGKWEITEEHPEIHLLQYHLSPEEYEKFRKEHGKKIPQIRKILYDTTIGKDKTVDCETAGQVFQNYGISCRADDFSVKKVDVYGIVKRAASGFRLPIPRIVVTNSVIPNAAASGPSPSLGTILITTGILTQLEDDELMSVVGHELSHLKARDPLVMSSLASAEFLLRFYVFWPYLFFLGFYSYIGYFVLAIGLIYFFGKFQEARADLDSAKIIGQPKTLAEALRKIAFRSLFPLFKREPAYQTYRRLEWLRFDPHPPAYFRISQLENLKDPTKIENTFLKSIENSLRGFLGA